MSCSIPLRAVTVLLLTMAFGAQVLADGKHGRAGKNEAVPDHQPLVKPVKLVIPVMDAVKGKELFIEKACITCHAVNGIGGEDGPRIDAHVMSPEMDVFQFAARMWNHSQGMLAAQLEELGEQIEMNGQELADITAFAHNDAVQHTLAEDDIPPRMRKMLHHDSGDEEQGEGHGDSPEIKHGDKPNAPEGQPHG